MTAFPQLQSLGLPASHSLVQPRFSGTFNSMTLETSAEHLAFVQTKTSSELIDDSVTNETMIPVEIPQKKYLTDSILNLIIKALNQTEGIDYELELGSSKTLVNRTGKVSYAATLTPVRLKTSGDSQKVSQFDKELQNTLNHRGVSFSYSA